ncbi:MAG: hypothetical protein LUC16_03225 [Coprobacillus sp.]|nr:hypothetical protein [Coprobacillus sp.]
MKVSFFEASLESEDTRKKDIITRFLEAGFDIDDKDPEIVIYMGGDGTFFRCVQDNLKRLNKVYLLGIGLGGVCSYYDYDYEHVDTLIRDLQSESLLLMKLPLIDLEVALDNGGASFYAVNDVRVFSRYRTIETNVYIDDELLESYRGSGLCIASSSGSSGFNRSNGGPLIDPELCSLTLSEIAPMNNYHYSNLGSPLVISSDKEITLYFEGESDAEFTFDSFHTDPVSIVGVKVKFSNKKVRLLRTPTYNVASHLGNLLIKGSSDGDY